MANSDVLEVFFVDGSRKSLALPPAKATMNDVWNAVVEKLEMDEYSASCFFIWLADSRLELLQFEDTIVADALKSWEGTVNAYAKHRGSGRNTHSKIVRRRLDNHEQSVHLYFRPTSVVTLSLERNIKSPIATHLFFLQAKMNFLAGNFVSAPDEVVALAGLQLQRAVGDHVDATHGTGYLVRNGIERYIPHNYIHDPQHAASKVLGGQGRTDEEWEALIIAEHKKHKGKSNLIVELLYLQICRQWPEYGSTFFAGTYATKDINSAYSCTVDVRVGVNESGLHLVTPTLMTRQSFPHDSVESVKAKKGTLRFRAKGHSHQVYTHCAELVVSLLNEWDSEKEDEERVLQSIRDMQSNRNLLELVDSGDEREEEEKK